MEIDIYLKWIQLLVNFFAIGAAGWIYKAYIQNLKSALSSKDEQINIVEKNMNFMKDKIADLEKKTPEFMEKILNERIKIRDNEIIRLSNDKSKNINELEIKRQERTRLKSELEKTIDVKRQLSFIGVDFDDYFFSRQGELEIEEMGMVAVDSGQLIITDPCYIDAAWENEKVETSQNFGYSYSGACLATESEKGYGELKSKSGYEGAGIVFSTAFGDGMYPVYGEKYNDKIIRVYVNVL
jgi:hypothetical protein